MEDNILEVDDLTVYQGNYPALRDVSFKLLKGTHTAIVGPNGAGKSTLVQAILGLIPRNYGKIVICDRPLEKLGNIHQQIGYIPQNFLFDRSFPISVWELVGIGWIKSNNILANIFRKKAEKNLQKIRYFWQENTDKKAAITAALKRVDAYNQRHQAIGTLSGGQLKRVLLAYCLVMPRQLLVLDEAFAGVDIQGEADFYTLLNELKSEYGWTVLQVSHDLDMVSKNCDRVLCLNQTLVCSGKPEIALSPQNLLNTYGPTFTRYHHHH